MKIHHIAKIVSNINEEGEKMHKLGFEFDNKILIDNEHNTAKIIQRLVSFYRKIL